jgi:hypothetical protein
MTCIGELVMTWEWEKLKEEHLKPNQKPNPIEKSLSTRVLFWLENNMIVFYVSMALITITLIFGMAYIAKHLSYWWWYEDLVKETIKEMVAPDSLIHLINKP